MAQKPGPWDVVSTAPAPQAQADGWNVVSTTPDPNAAPQLPAHAAPPVGLAGPPSAPQGGFFGSASDSSGLSALGSAIAHPVDTAKSIVRSAVNPYDQQGAFAKTVVPLVQNTVDNVKQGISDYRKSGLSPTTRRDFGRAVPIAGPVLAKAQEQHDAGNDAGMAGTLTGFVGGAVAPEAALSGVKALPGIAKRFVVGDVTAPMPGSNITPLQRFNSAKSLGVNLDAADATNSGILKGVKKINENSLLGGNSYEKLGAANTSALQGSTDNFLNGLYQGDRESGGRTIQSALKANQQGLYSTAQNGFDSLPQDVPIPGLAEVGKTAQDIAQQNSAYQNLFPSLKPSKAMNVVGDVGGLGPKAPPPVKMSPFVDERGNPIQSSIQPPTQQPASFGTGQKLRSDLLDFTRNNPDIVQNQGNGFIQRLAGQTDEALTNASSSLTPSQLSTFRDANAAWKDMKGAYDDPSSPLYHAVRTDNPSSLYGGVGPKTPENARNLESRLGSAIQPLRRGTVESALKPTNEGAPNFKTFGTQLNRIPADYRSELFSPDQNAKLKDIANTSNVLYRDYNPSGSAKLGQKIFEAGELGAALAHPAAAIAPLAQYPIAKMMTSPKAVNWMMSPSAPVSQLTLPASSGLTGASLMAAPKGKGLYGR